jgi:hypothetical protein
VSTESTSLGIRSLDDLELMAMEMYRVLLEAHVSEVLSILYSSSAYQVAVQIVHYYFNYFAILENVWIDTSINDWVRYIGLVDSER